MEELIKSGDTVLYLIDFKDQDFEHRVEFEVYEVMSWSLEGEVMETEDYLTGYIKWDGCSHIWFSDEGYKHLCGKSFWDNHAKVMSTIWDMCTKKIKNFDKELAG